MQRNAIYFGKIYLILLLTGSNNVCKYSLCTIFPARRYECKRAQQYHLGGK